MTEQEPTFRHDIDEQKPRWEPMRSYLRPNQQPLYDQLWLYSDRHAGAVDRATFDDPMIGILMAICLGQQRELQKIKYQM